MALIHRDCLFEISWQSYTNWWDVIMVGWCIPLQRIDFGFYSGIVYSKSYTRYNCT